MNGTVFALTLRQILSQKRIRLAALAVGLLPVGLALIYRMTDGDDPVDWTANALLATMMIALILPLVCLLIGESAMGTEIEDGTAAYLLSKPIPRGDIVLAKSLAAGLVSGVIVLPAMVVAPLISLEGAHGDGLVLAFLVAAALGVGAYTLLFVFLSVATNRPLIVGIAYVFIWEGVLGDLFSGTRYLSIRQYCLGIADGIADTPERYLDAELGGVVSLTLILAVIAGTAFLATRSLVRFELPAED